MKQIQHIGVVIIAHHLSNVLQVDHKYVNG